MAEIKLHRLSRVTLPKDDREGADSIKRSKAICGNDRARGLQILLEAQSHYSAAYKFREDRDRNKRYTYGDQWGDMVCVDGSMMTEEAYIKSQGNVPLKNNLIRRLVRNVNGSYINQSTEPRAVARDRNEQQLAETMNTLLEYNMQLNQMELLNTGSMEEFLIGGMPIQRKWYGWRQDKMDCWTDTVAPNNFIPDSNMRDLRMWDCSFVGEIHDVNFDELISQFAKTPADFEMLKEIYKQALNMYNDAFTWEQFGIDSRQIHKDFFMPTNPNRCRVIEVWRKESKPRYRCHDYNTGEIFKCEVEDLVRLVIAKNNERLAMAQRNGIPEDEIPYIKAEWFIDSYWYYYYLSPFGDILAEGETPYKHKSHPYVFRAYPFIDGEVHSFVSDVIDQQRYTNRLIIMQDWIMRASAKGVLMIPEDCIPDGMEPQDFADEWAKFNGVIIYKPNKSGKTPEQIANNSTNIGIHELLSLQLKFFEDISGVSAALQGKSGFAGESGQHAQLMAQQAATSLVDMFVSFNEFVREGAYKDIKNIQQFYDEKKVREIVGNTSVDISKIYDMECDINMQQSPSSAQYRAWANDFLMQLFNARAIDIKQLLSVAKDLPYADALLQSIESQEAAVANGQVPEGVSPEMMQQVQQQANPRSMQMLQQAMGVGQMAA